MRHAGSAIVAGELDGLPVGQIVSRWAQQSRDTFLNRIQQLPLRLQMVLLVGSICVILVGVVSVGAAALGRRQAETDAAGRMALLARELGHRLDTNMAQRFDEIGRLAGLAPLQPFWTGNPAMLRSVLDQLQASYPSYAWIGFATPDGMVQAATGGLLEGKSVAARAWFSRGVHGPSVVDLHEATLLTALLGKPGDAEPLRFVDVAFPVHGPDGALVGVLAAHLYSRWIGDMRENFKALLAAAEPGSDRVPEISVLTADGHEIVGPNPGEAVLTPEQAQQVSAAGSMVRVVTVDGQRTLESLAATQGERTFPGFGWIVSAQEPVSVAFRPVRTMVKTILAAGAAVAVAGVVSLFLLAGRLSSPIRRLCIEAGRLGRAEPGAKLKHVGGCREVLLLSHALRSLVRRIGVAEQQLLDARERVVASSAQMAALRQLADCDPMTGLLNRRGFLDAVRQHTTQPPAGVVGVLIIDIDHFKRVNDRFGHAVGDTVIRCVADIIKRTVRHDDVVARFGGEEFVVFTPHTTAASLLSLAERIRQAVQQTRAIPSADAVTVSIGAALEEAADHDVQDTIDRADSALYGAKGSGRNCVRLNNPARAAELSLVAA